MTTITPPVTPRWPMIAAPPEAVEAGALTAKEKANAKKIDDFFAGVGGHWGKLVPFGTDLVEVCKALPLDPALGSGVVQQESLGRNIFGCDWGSRWTNEPPFCNVPVTKGRVGRLIDNYNSPPPGVGANGIGLNQITSMPYVLHAEKIGGAHVQRNQLVAGFTSLRDRINNLGYADGLAAYNAGEGNLAAGRQYAASVMALHEQWKTRLGQQVPDSGRILPRPSNLHTPGSGPYVNAHPTHYNWRGDVYDLVVKYLNHPKLKGKVWINTYHDHPPGWGLDAVSFDVWDWGGRGVSLTNALRKLVFDIIFNDPEGPKIRWLISGGALWSSAGGWEPWDPPEDGSDAGHWRHSHWTFW